MDAKVLSQVVGAKEDRVGRSDRAQKQKVMTRLGFDPRTLSVLRIRDNQLHHPADFNIFGLSCIPMVRLGMPERAALRA